MNKPRLLDLFCCAGGAGMGYHRAGFEVVGVDIAPQPHYPFEFHQADALEYAAEHGHEFDAIHASPPCQGYSHAVTSSSSKYVLSLGKDEPRLIGAVRNIIPSGKPYVIENVVGAAGEIYTTVMLCGYEFGLPVARHRLFESNILIPSMPHNCTGYAKEFAELRGWDYRDMSVTGKGRRAGTSDRWKEILGISWDVTQHELAEAIPPAYTEYIGKFLMDALQAA